ncbi:MAG: hypothetical protein GXP62_03260, partial [Oligoflexia bacterium]|nr:hypothetical protein [Oligoflexia bacterium]
LDPIMGEVDR